MSEQLPLTEAALLARIALGEHSRQQFKRSFSNPDALAAELAAFANSGGGTLLIGVNDDGSLAGLDAAELRRLNQMLSNVSSQHVRPPVHPHTDNVQTHAGLVMVVAVPNGLAKPYLDQQGRIWVKQGADKRHVTARGEMQRMFQSGGLVYADVVPVTGTTSADLDEAAFRRYLAQHYSADNTLAGLPFDTLLHNLGLGDGHELTLAGLMLFGRNPCAGARRSPSTPCPSGSARSCAARAAGQRLGTPRLLHQRVHPHPGVSQPHRHRQPWRAARQLEH